MSAERLGKIVPEPSKRRRFTNSVEDGFWRVHLAEEAEHEQPVRPVGNEQGGVRLKATRIRAVADVVAFPGGHLCPFEDIGHQVLKGAPASAPHSINRGLNFDSVLLRSLWKPSRAATRLSRRSLTS